MDIEISTTPNPRAGLLTAGEWNDLHNWNRHWVDLLTDGEISAFQKTYQCFPSQRYTVLLESDDGLTWKGQINIQAGTETRICRDLKTNQGC